MDYEVGQKITVIDSVDKTSREGKIVEVDSEKQMFQFHYKGFSNRYDEWINFDSDRIVEDFYEPSQEAITNTPYESVGLSRSKEALGSLLRKANDASRQILNVFQLESSNDKNIKNNDAS